MSRNYNVFLSWSGERSRLVADYLRGWLSSVVQAAKPWMSDSEIDKGSRSLGEIAKALSDIKVGIICLTPENLDRPWLLFEGGALSKSIDERTRLCTYLIGGLEPAGVSPPLGMFQGTMATKAETLKLVRTINRVVSEDPISDESLDEVFEAMWPKLESRLESLPAPVNPIPAKRPSDEIMAEILELVRAQASQREKTRFMDAYLPMFRQFLPLLEQVVLNTGRPVPVPRKRLGYPVDTSLERTGSDGMLNTFGFPRTLQNAIPIDPRHSGRQLALVQMFGSSAARADGHPYTDLRFTVRGINLSTNSEETYDINFILEIPTARKIALYLEQAAEDAERNQARFVLQNIQQVQKVQEDLEQANKTPPPEG